MLITSSRIAIRSWSQGWRVFHINRQRRLAIAAQNAQNDLSFTSVLCLQKLTALVSVIPLLKFRIPTSQLALNQSYAEKTNVQNNNDEAKKSTFGSHSISVNYCNIIAYCQVTNNKVKATLTVLGKLAVNIFDHRQQRKYLFIYPQFDQHNSLQSCARKRFVV